MKWLDYLTGQRPAPPIDDALWREALARCPALERLSEAERQQLRELAAGFLKHKRFHPIDIHLDDAQRLLIAIQACIPIRHMGLRVLRDWRTVIVYPGEFRVRRDQIDDAGLVSEDHQILAGEAWPKGPLVLSWGTVEHSLSQPWDGHNVIAHEIAHKLDMRNGPPDGLPVLPRHIKQQTWIDTFQAAYERLIEAMHRGEYIDIDHYAATNPSEYFAVASEMHFSAPDRLRDAEPGVAQLLHDYYGPSPAP